MCCLSVSFAIVASLSEICCRHRQRLPMLWRILVVTFTFSTFFKCLQLIRVDSSSSSSLSMHLLRSLFKINRHRYTLKLDNFWGGLTDSIPWLKKCRWERFFSGSQMNLVWACSAMTLKRRLTPNIMKKKAELLSSSMIFESLMLDNVYRCQNFIAPLIRRMMICVTFQWAWTSIVTHSTLKHTHMRQNDED